MSYYLENKYAQCYTGFSYTCSFHNNKGPFTHAVIQPVPVPVLGGVHTYRFLHRFLHRFFNLEQNNTTWSFLGHVNK